MTMRRHPRLRLVLVALVACDQEDASPPERDAAGADVSRDGAADSDRDGAVDSDDFECSAGGLTIPASKRCDGVIDCRGSNPLAGSDERDCEGSFFCPYIGARGNGARVIPLEKFCDGWGDCDLAEDERDCPELDNHFCDRNDEGLTLVYSADEICDGRANCFFADDEHDCPNSVICARTCFGGGTEAVLRSELCDGKWDCMDDEFDCPGSADPFVCNDGRAMDRKYLCDGSGDCLGGEDEDTAVCPDQYLCSVVEWADSCSPHPTSQRLSPSQVCDGVLDCKGSMWCDAQRGCYTADERDCP